MNKLKMWKEHSSWEEAERAWDEGAKQAAQIQALKGLSKMPSMPGITEDTAKNLKWKSLKWMVTQDTDRKVLKGFLKHPFRYGWNLLYSMLKGKSYRRDGDFFFYGIKNEEQFQRLVNKDHAIVCVGFSYCHKPFECPSGRFSDQCVHDEENPVCRQCFIGKCVHALPEENVVTVFIPTVHYIGAKIIELVEAYPERNILFLITACEMTLEMFGDYGNMAGIRGIGVRLDGRICNTMKAFELSEKGIKPGLTVVKESTQKRMLDLIKYMK